MNPSHCLTPTGTVNRQQSCSPPGKDHDTQASCSWTPPRGEAGEEGGSQTGEAVPQTLAPGQVEGRVAGREEESRRYQPGGRRSSQRASWPGSR